MRFSHISYLSFFSEILSYFLFVNRILLNQVYGTTFYDNSKRNLKPNLNLIQLEFQAFQSKQKYLR